MRANKKSIGNNKLSPHRDSTSWLINTYDKNASNNDLHNHELGPGKYETIAAFASKDKHVSMLPSSMRHSNSKQ